MNRIALIFAAMVALAAPAGAATLSVAQGDVLVNSGNGFVRGSGGQALRAGDRVMVGSGGGNATIAYAPTCLENVQRGGVVTVREGVPCKSAGTSAMEPTNGTPSRGDGSTAVADPHGGIGGGGGIGIGTIAIGAVVIAGAGYLIYEASRGKSD